MKLAQGSQTLSEFASAVVKMFDIYVFRDDPSRLSKVWLGRINTDRQTGEVVFFDCA